MKQQIPNLPPKKPSCINMPKRMSDQQNKIPTTTPEINSSCLHTSESAPPYEREKGRRSTIDDYWFHNFWGWSMSWIYELWIQNTAFDRLISGALVYDCFFFLFEKAFAEISSFDICSAHYWKWSFAELKARAGGLLRRDMIWMWEFIALARVLSFFTREANGGGN